MGDSLLGTTGSPQTYFVLIYFAEILLEPVVLSYGFGFGVVLSQSLLNY